jgi:hypothetical protein
MDEEITQGIMECWNLGMLGTYLVCGALNPIVPAFQGSLDE